MIGFKYNNNYKHIGSGSQIIKLVGKYYKNSLISESFIKERESKFGNDAKM